MKGINEIQVFILSCSVLVFVLILGDLFYRIKREKERTKRAKLHNDKTLSKQIYQNIDLIKSKKLLQEDLDHMKHMYNELFDVLKKEINGIKK